MKAFLEKFNGQWLEDFVYASYFPLYNKGIDIISFNGETIKESTVLAFETTPAKEDICIASVEATTKFFQTIGVKTPPYLGYPETLKNFLHRKIIKVEVKDLPNKFPYFVKPADNVKQFTGTLVDNEKQLDIFKTYYDVNETTLLLMSEPIELLAEYRCFVHRRKLKGIQYYKGDFKLYPNIETIEQMIDKYQDSPVAYTLDVGITHKLSTLLIEINDFWALGSYGFDPEIYVRMTIDRFRQITNLPIK